MFGFTKDFSCIFLKFLDISEFVSMASVNKKHLEDIRYYFKTMKIIYNKYNIEKTFKNCLLKKRGEVRFRLNINKDIYEIVKVIKKENSKMKNKDYRIYYWCISKPMKIGSDKNGYKNVIYPNHDEIEENEINDSALIPFRNF